MENEGRMPEASELSDEDFVKAYQENGFGWSGRGEEIDKPIWDRHKQLRETKPDLYPPKPSVNINPAVESDQPGNRHREVSHNDPTNSRNLDGQYVDPKTNEPVREGSPEWQELAKRNQLPRNQ